VSRVMVLADDLGCLLKFVVMQSIQFRELLPDDALCRFHLPMEAMVSVVVQLIYQTVALLANLLSKMAAPVDDMFSLCVDPSKVTSSVEVRFIDNLKPVSTAYVLWRLLKKMPGGSAATLLSAFHILSCAVSAPSSIKPALSAR
ncbi:hypothetical protein XENOCAPTIV_010455, partial [Xenoophorus captivus]